MSFGATRTTKTIDKEILKFPAGLDSIESIVLMASGVDELASATTGQTGVIGLLAGTVLSQLTSGADSQERYKPYESGGSEVVAGILGDTVYFHDNTDASDKPADMLFHGCVFDKAKLTGYTGNEAAVEAALPTCRFETKD